jgi:hypothetical protein
MHYLNFEFLYTILKSLAFACFLGSFHAVHEALSLNGG